MPKGPCNWGAEMLEALEDTITAKEISPESEAMHLLTKFEEIKLK